LTTGTTETEATGVAARLARIRARLSRLPDQKTGNDTVIDSGAYRPPPLATPVQAPVDSSVDTSVGSSGNSVAGSRAEQDEQAEPVSLAPEIAEIRRRVDLLAPASKETKPDNRSRAGRKPGKASLARGDLRRVVEKIWRHADRTVFNIEAGLFRDGLPATLQALKDDPGRFGPVLNPAPGQTGQTGKRQPADLRDCVTVLAAVNPTAVREEETTSEDNNPVPIRTTDRA